MRLNPFQLQAYLYTKTDAGETDFKKNNSLQNSELTDLLAENFANSVDITGDDISLIGIDTLRLLGGSTELFADNSLDISEGVDILLNTDIVSRLTNLADDIKKLLLFSI